MLPLLAPSFDASDEHDSLFSGFLQQNDDILTPIAVEGVVQLLTKSQSNDMALNVVDLMIHEVSKAVENIVATENFLRNPGILGY